MAENTKPEISSDETARESIWDFRNLDKFVIIFAAVLTFCAFAVLFRPAMGEAIGKVFLQLMVEPPPQPKPVVTPGVVDMQLYTTPAKPAAKPQPQAEPKKK
jgi:hypothetical protein